MGEDKRQFTRDAELLLREFENPETLLQENPLFSRIYMTLCYGESPYKIIEQLVRMIEDQQQTLNDLVSNKPNPPITIELTKDNLELVFQEAFFSGGEFPDW